MAGALTRELRGSLAASREQADRVLAAAEHGAHTLGALAAETDRARGDARLRRLAVLQAEIEAQQRRIQTGYAEMAEALAATAARLATAAREADYSIPPWSGEIHAAIEVKLTETREMTIRLQRGAPRAQGDSLRRRP